MKRTAAEQRRTAAHIAAPCLAGSPEDEQAVVLLVESELVAERPAVASPALEAVAVG